MHILELCGKVNKKIDIFNSMRTQSVKKRTLYEQRQENRIKCELGFRKYLWHRKLGMLFRRELRMCLAHARGTKEKFSVTQNQKIRRTPSLRTIILLIFISENADS